MSDGLTFAELLDRVLATPQARTSGRSERRGGLRVDLRVPIEFQLIKNEGISPPIVARLCNLSVGGVGLLARLRLEPQQRFFVTCREKIGGVLIVIYSVRRCEQVTSGLFRIGASMEKSVRKQVAAAVPSSPAA